jgi:hypothetical protein
VSSAQGPKTPLQVEPQYNKNRGKRKKTILVVFRATARDATTNSTTVVKIGGKEKRKKSGCLPRRPETPLQVDESYKNREKKKKRKIWLTS